MTRDHDNPTDDLLGDNFDEIGEIDENCVVGEANVLPVTPDDALACESSSLTVLPNGQPVAIWRLPRITVSVAGKSSAAVYNGTRCPIKDEQAALLLLGIVEAKGQTVTAKQIAAQHFIFDPSHAYRAMKAIPRELKALIESRPGKGYRLRLLT